jgi:glycosyltransferase involved in cell wall biosynthesis
VTLADGARISVITPTLNAEAYLRDCLASVQNQAIDGLEHLVIDGGSSDHTAEIACQYPTVTWISRPGLNQTQAINAGLRLASGKIVAWLNADDLYLTGVLQLVIQQFRVDTNVELLYGDCQVIGPNNEPLWWEQPGPYDFRRLLRRGNYIAQPAAFMQRRLFDAVGYLDESLEYGMDYDLWLRLRGHRVAYLPRPLASFRWHPDSKSARGQLRSWNEFLRIVRRHGGGWTPQIAWAYIRCLLTIARMRVTHAATGSTPVRPLTRGTTWKRPAHPASGRAEWRRTLSVWSTDFRKVRR